jgi:hypothetical protein
MKNEMLRDDGIRAAEVDQLSLKFSRVKVRLPPVGVGNVSSLC